MDGGTPRAEGKARPHTHTWRIGGFRRQAHSPPAPAVQALGPAADAADALLEPGCSGEARDVLKPLPSINGRGSQHRSSQSGGSPGRSSHTGEALPILPLAGAGRASGRPLANWPSRTLGSLTAWQMLAADIQREMETAAAAGGGSARTSQLSDGGRLSCRSLRDRSSQASVDANLVMASDAAEVPLPWEMSGQRRSSANAAMADLPADGSAASNGSSTGAASSGEAPSSSRLEQEYEVLGELGRGAFGSALKARRRADGCLVCLKALVWQSMGASERRMTRDEVRVLRSLAHPNVIQYHSCFTDGGVQYIAMEYAEEGDLEKMLKARGGELLPEGQLMMKFVQLCLGLQHVHAQGIIHRDIKTSNILIGRHGIVKLGDFGISKIMAPGKSHASTMVGTPYYFAPELVEDKPYSKKADVWAAGCVLYELATLQRPFRGSSVSAIAVKILRGTYAPLPEQYSPELHALVATLLRRKPEQRPSIDEVLSMPYVRLHMKRYRDYVAREVDHRKQSYFHSLDGYDLDGLRSSTMGGTLALGVAAAKLLRQRSQQGLPVGPSFNRQVSTGASRFSVAAGSTPAAAAAVGPAGTMVVNEGTLPSMPSPDLVSALAAVEAAAAQADSMQPSDATVAANLPPPAFSPAAEAAAVGPPARPPRRTTFSAREYMQAAGLASLAAAAPHHLQEQLPLQPTAAPVELPGLVLPGKARRASSSPGSPSSMTGAQLGSLSSVETGEVAANLRGSSQGTETEAGRITPEAGQTAVALVPQGALAPPPIPPLGSADEAAPNASTSELSKRPPALLSQFRQLLGLPMQMLPAAWIKEGTGSGGVAAEEQAPQQRRRASWRGAEQACGEELAAVRQRTQHLAAVLPPPAFRK